MSIKNLVFRGGGVPAAIAYPGALVELEEQGLLKEVETVTGTSAGAIIAAALAVGVPIDMLKEMVFETNFSRFADDDCLFIRDTIRLIKNLGWNKGVFFTEWLKELFEATTGKPEITFKELTKYKLYIPATMVTTYGLKCKVFCADNAPDMPVWQAVRASMSIPFFFEPIKLFDLMWTDGGESYNYPINIKDTEDINWDTLGFSVGTREEISVGDDIFDLSDLGRYKDVGSINLLRAIPLHLEYMLSQANKTYIKPDDWKRTVFIDRGSIKATDFSLSYEAKKKLFEAGRKGVVDYLTCKNPNP